MKVSNEVKVGILATVAIVLLVLGFNLLRGKNVFSRDNVFYIRYDDAAGVASAGSVLFKGMKVGHVIDIKLAPDASGKIVVSIAIDREIKIPKGSTATVISPDIISPKAILLEFTTATDYYVDHDTLVAKISRKGLEEVQTKAEALIVSLDSAINSISSIFNSETRLNLQKSIKSIQTTLITLDRATSKVDVMLNDNVSRLDRIFANIESITANLNQNHDEINTILSNLATISDTLRQSEISATIQQAKETLEELSVVIEKINSGEGSLGLLVNDEKLYNNLESSSKSLDSLLVDFKSNPDRYVQVSVFGKKDKSSKDSKSK